MVCSQAKIERLRAWSRDLSLATPVIGYYMKMFTVEQCLGIGEPELRTVAAELLDEIEKFKAEVSKDTEDTGAAILIEDQEKAKAFMLHFALKMQNGILETIGFGEYNPQIAKGIWCCMDMFECILHLWGSKHLSTVEIQECKRRIKLSKFSLTKGSRGEQLTVSKPNEADVDSVQESGFLDMPAVPVFLDEEQEQSDHESELIEGLGEIESDTREVHDGSVNSVPKREELSKESVDQLMEREHKMDEVQKLAKYAMNALNYDDIPTAKKELLRALEILNSL